MNNFVFRNMKNKRENMIKLFTRLLLGVFLFAITPFSIFHQHESRSVQVAEEHCTHKIHVTTQKDNCLVCKAHFEKAFILSNEVEPLINLYQDFKFINLVELDVDTEIPHAQLRGPPSLS